MKNGNEAAPQQLPKSRGEAAYFVKLPVFEGPFELLYYLIKKDEINIWDISLARITEEYLNYLRSMQELRIDLAGEFLVMAAGLLHLKSKLLLPKPPQELTPKEEEAFFFGSKEELVHRLLEYSRFKHISTILKQRETAQMRIFLRSPGQPQLIVLNRQSSLYPHSFEILRKTYQRLQNKKVKKEKQEEPLPVPEENTLNDRIKAIWNTIKKMAVQSFSLEKLFQTGDKREIVVTFFALLELTRRGKVLLRQKNIFGRIQILKSGKSR